MDRLQKKCFIVSAGMHLLLAIILFIGPAFLSPRSKTDDLALLDFVPVKTVDALISGGGNPKAAPPAPVLAPQSPPPVVPSSPQPRPEPEPAPPPKPEPSLEPDPESRKPKVSTTVITRNRDTEKEAKARTEAEAKASAAAADARRRLANAFSGAAAHIGGSVSGGTTVELKGPGGGGLPYANFLQAVKTRYTEAWVVPDGVTDDDATVAASVTIARDGTVVSASITRSSGNVAVDRSVQVTLDRVRYAAPLPDDAKENQRTVTINFNVRTKRLAG